MSLDTSEGVVRNLYAAAAQELPWSQALGEFDRHVGATGTVLFGFSQPGSVPFCSQSLDRATKAYVHEGWYRLDERFRGVPAMRTGRIISDLDIFAPSQIAKLPFYQEFIARHDLKWWAGMLVRASDREYVLSVQRSAKQSRFTSGEHRQLRAIKPHLANALFLQEMQVRARHDGMLDMLDAFSQAAFLISQDSRVLRANRRGQDLLGHGLAIVGGRLTAETHEGCEARGKLLNPLRHPETSIRVLAPTVVIPRKSGRSLIAGLVGACSIAVEMFRLGGTIVRVCDPDAYPHRNEEVLAVTFKLTPAEAALAVRLAAGMSLKDYALQFCLAHETVRTLMKRILSKTDTRRQGEFIALANRISAGGAINCVDENLRIDFG